MSLEALIQHYGLPVLIVGLFLEGETVLLLAGFLAGRGYFSFTQIVLIGFFVTLAADQGYFWLGYRYGKRLLDRFPRLAPAVERAHSLFERYRMQFVVGFRFVYGLRVVTPILIGTTRFSPRRFLLLNSMATAAWVLGTTLAGLVFGHATAALLDDLHRYEAVVVGLIAAGGTAFAYFRWQRIKREGRSAPLGDDDRRPS